MTAPVPDLRALAAAVMTGKTALAALTDRQARLVRACFAAMGAAGAERLRVLGPDREDLGTVAWTAGAVTAVVNDPVKLLEWVEGRYPTEVMEVPATRAVRPAFLAGLLARAKAAGDPVDVGGEVIPGVTVNTGEPHLTTTPSKVAYARGEALLVGGEPEVDCSQGC